MESHAVMGNVTARAFKGWSGVKAGRQQSFPSNYNTLPQPLIQKSAAQHLRRPVIRSQAAREDKPSVTGQKARPMGVHGGFNSTLATGRKASGTPGTGNKVLLSPVDGMLGPEFGLFDNFVDSFTTDMDKRIACLERQFEEWEAVAKETMDILTIVRKRCAQQKLETKRSELEVGLKADLSAAVVHPLEAILGSNVPFKATTDDKDAVKGLSTVAAASGLKADARSTTNSIKEWAEGKEVKASKAKPSLADDLVGAALNSRPIRRARIQHKRMLKSTTRSTQMKGKLGWDGDLMIWSRL